MDTQLRVHTAVIAVLAPGPCEGSELLKEVTQLLGECPSPIVWRNTLIELTNHGDIKRTVILDDDEQVQGVSYALPPTNETKTGARNEPPSTAA